MKIIEDTTRVKSSQLRFGDPMYFCEICGKVFDSFEKIKKCTHQFCDIVVTCDAMGIWQRKQLEGLIGQKTSFVSHTFPHNEWADLIDFHWFRDNNHLKQILQLAGKRKFITHNYSNITPMTTLLHDNESIFVIHDLYWVGLPATKENEKYKNTELQVLKYAKNLVVPSKRFYESIRDYLPKKAQVLIQHQRVPKRYFTYSNIKTCDVVYEGRIHEQWLEYFENIKRAGFNLKIFVSFAKEEELALYQEAEIETSFRLLLDKISRAKWGLVGNPQPYEASSRGMSNKFCDYIASGVVPIVLNHSSVADVVKEYKFGVVAKSPQEVVDILGNDNLYQKLYRTLMKKRYKFTMESQKKDWDEFINKIYG